MAEETGVLNFDKYKREFRRYLEDQDGDRDIKKKVQRMLSQGSTRLMVDLNDMRAYDEQQRELDPNHESIANGLLHEPADRLPAFEAQLKDLVDAEEEGLASEKKAKVADREYHIGVEGSFGANLVSPRELRSPLLAQMVCVEGIITKAATVRPKVTKSVHYCPATHQSISREYRDNTSFRGLPTGSTYPTKDDNGNLLETEFGLSTYSDTQRIIIQEMPERSPPGQLPCSVQVTITDDLCDLCKPGDRVQIVGVYRAHPSTKGGSTNGQFKTQIIGNSIKVLSKEMLQPVMKDSDIQNIKGLSQKDNVFELLSSSLAPSIYGHTEVKQAMLLLLLGGVERNLENGTHIRGDINMLMIGDPSTAKSQMLRSVMNVAPLAISTTGRGSSGVGLTAAVTVDSDSGEKRLEAGAMVLADRGMVCIDEFDKMSDADRVAIHEVMEQQTVTIAKAGIHASLNARCSVVAAANPIYGTYDRTLSPIRNIGLPDSLLSRFDLLFVVLDQKDEEVDRAVSDHVLRLHRYCLRGQEGVPMTFTDKYELDGGEEEEEEDESSVFQRRDRLLNRFANGDILKTKFLKKYIHYAKSRVEPSVSKDATDHIIDFYTELRSQHSGDHNTLPVTVRTLETIIRLSCAHAKCRLSEVVEAKDVGVASALMRAAIFSETYSSTKDNHNRDRGAAMYGGPREDEEDDQQGGADDNEDGADAEMAVENDITPEVPESGMKHDAEKLESPSKRQRTDDGEQATKQAEEKEDEVEDAEGLGAEAASRTFDGPRDKMLTSTLIRMFTADDDIISITPSELLQEADAEREQTSKALQFRGLHNPFETPFSETELMPLLEFLNQESRIMMDEGKIYKLV